MIKMIMHKNKWCWVGRVALITNTHLQLLRVQAQTITLFIIYCTMMQNSYQNQFYWMLWYRLFDHKHEFWHHLCLASQNWIWFQNLKPNLFYIQRNLNFVFYFIPTECFDFYQFGKSVELRGRCDTTMFFLHLNDVTKRFILVYVTMQEEECDEHNNQNNKIQNRKQPQKTRSIKNL